MIDDTDLARIAAAFDACSITLLRGIFAVGAESRARQLAQLQTAARATARWAMDVLPVVTDSPFLDRQCVLSIARAWMTDRYAANATRAGLTDDQAELLRLAIDLGLTGLDERLADGADAEPDQIPSGDLANDSAESWIPVVADMRAAGMDAEAIRNAIVYAIVQMAEAKGMPELAAETFAAQVARGLDALLGGGPAKRNC